MQRRRRHSSSPGIALTMAVVKLSVACTDPAAIKYGHAVDTWQNTEYAVLVCLMRQCGLEGNVAGALPH